jgi:hypothetical protein
MKKSKYCLTPVLPSGKDESLPQPLGHLNNTREDISPNIFKELADGNHYDARSHSVPNGIHHLPGSLHLLIALIRDESL